MQDGFSTLIQDIFAKLETSNWMLATAESCTGGLISAAITAESGSSAYFDRGFVTYSNAAKIDMLGVQAKTLDAYGAVSEQTAIEMAQGAFKNSQANIAISVTGIAGPTGGSAEKPVGLVYIGCATQDNAFAQQFNFDDMTREDVRGSTVKEALSILLTAIIPPT